MPPSWFEHVDLMQILLVCALGYMVWSFKQGLARFEMNIAKLFTMYGTLKSQVDVLQGEHNIKVCGNRRRADDLPSRENCSPSEVP